ncbi:MAG: non-ribosomal peptide synthetase [Pseudonocardia sp.]
MGTPTEAWREFWPEVLRSGGSTTIPRWTLTPTAGVSAHEAPIPTELVARVRRLAEELGVPSSAVLLAAHAKVLAALSGDLDVIAGYLSPATGRQLPCRLATGPTTWRALLAGVHRTESAVLAHQDAPLDELRRELRVAGPSYETVIDPAGAADPPGSLAGDVALWLCFQHCTDGHQGTAGHQSGNGPALLLRYRTDAADADCAARIAGYHLRALELITADPDADHTRQSLLSAEELHYQVEGLAGPRKPLPDARFHELFEQRVRQHPDAVAAVHGDTTWTYAELNSRANQLGRALLARGLTREGVVAVVTERNLDWMAAVIGIFKAGGAYLPIEPHFPAERIRKSLARAECRWVLTERDSTATLEGALPELPGVEPLFVDAAYAEGHPDGDLGIEVGPDQLAYIYFTSGSTGEPKGAMCEQDGMLNHLYAKLEDMGFGEGEVLAQTAPQCFDISLWQLVAALLMGGRTLLVEQEAILDVARFVDKIVEQRVNLAQLVPSYLEVVVSYLEANPRELPDLHCVSTTGEALKKELTQRWFAVQPGIRIGNAYGLTETSDDVNHEVMDRVTHHDRVPLGPAVRNVHMYVVDEHLAPVPLGAPGEIVFSGVCVGRGYVNDPERTAAAFLDDPVRPGERLYRSGDHGRWLPEGKLEFLGRRDSQVKIRGFRIEIGEIDNVLLRVPGVRDGAVVVAERDAGKQLVAFYTGQRAIEVDVLRERLAAALPEYMVPAAFHHRESLPLTGNGKIDVKALTALAAELAAVEQDYHAPATPTEQRLARAWADIVGVPAERIGRRDHFFDLGGSSLSAVKLAVTLKRAVSLRDITRTPVLADLAALLDERAAGDVAPTGNAGRAGSSGSAAAQIDALLQPLAEPTPNGAAPNGVLVCFPYAGGNAVTFQPMAGALRASGLAVYAVELPGHDLTESSASGTSIDAARREAFAPLTEIVERVVPEISTVISTVISARTTARTSAQVPAAAVCLWGHSAGAAFALATARELHRRGIAVDRVFVGAQLPGDAATRRAAVADLGARTNAEIAARLSAGGGYTELAELDAQRAEHIGAAYRHDYVAANTWFADALEHPPAEKLPAPITVVLAADDPSTARFPGRHTDWTLFAEVVELRLLDDGGHYFLRTRAGEAAKAVLAAADRIASP